MSANMRVTLSLVDDFTKRITGVEGSLGSFGRKIDGIASNVTRFAKGLAVLVAANQLKQLVTEAISFGSAIEDMANRIGVTTDELQKLDFVAKMGGTSAGSLAKSFKEISLKAYDAYNGNKQAAESFESLGVSVRDSNGNLRGTNDIYNELLIAVSKIENPTERAAIATKLFGKSSQEVMGIVSEGEEKIQKSIDTQKKYNLVLGGDSVKALGEAGDQMDIFKLSMSLLSSELAVVLLPALSVMVGWLAKASAELRALGRIKDTALDSQKTQANDLSALLSLYEQQFDTSSYREGLGLVIEDNKDLNAEVENLEKNLGYLGMAFEGDLLTKMKTARSAFEELNTKLNPPTVIVDPDAAQREKEAAEKAAKERESAAKHNAERLLYWKEEERKVNLYMETKALEDAKRISDEAARQTEINFEQSQAAADLSKKAAEDMDAHKDRMHLKEMARLQAEREGRAEVARAIIGGISSVMTAAINASNSENKRTRARMVMLAALTFAEGVAMSVIAAAEAWKSYGTGGFYSKLAIAISTGAAFMASTIASVASIKSQKFERGGMARTGLAMVGESGPELVKFSRPGQVYTAQQTRDIVRGSGSGPNVTLNFYDQSGNLTDKVTTQVRSGQGDRLIDEIAKQMRQRGTL